jgi:hypothetical protein
MRALDELKIKCPDWKWLKQNIEKEDKIGTLNINSEKWHFK